MLEMFEECCTVAGRIYTPSRVRDHLLTRSVVPVARSDWQSIAESDRPSVGRRDGRVRDCERE
jgi:hypothetical protein